MWACRQCVTRVVDKKEKKKPKKVGTGITVTAEHRAYTFLSQGLEIPFRALCRTQSDNIALPKKFNERFAALICSLWHIVDCSGFFVATGN